MPAFHLASGPWRLPSGMPVRWIGRSIGLKTLTGCGSWSRPTVVTASETDRVRVGMLAPVAWRVPPVHCGPWERVVSILPEGLVARGVDGTLFATADSTTRARLVAVAPRGYAEDPSLDAKVYECLHR
jgi:hypothetical protein